VLVWIGNLRYRWRHRLNCRRGIHSWLPDEPLDIEVPENDSEDGYVVKHYTRASHCMHCSAAQSDVPWTVSYYVRRAPNEPTMVELSPASAVEGSL
jgi:hypothetical protein